MTPTQPDTPEEGIAFVRDAQGNILTREHLPQPGVRWTGKRKAILISAFDGGLVSKQELEEKYLVSGIELGLWRRQMSQQGPPGLRSTYAKHDGSMLQTPWSGFTVPGSVCVDDLTVSLPENTVRNGDTTLKLGKAAEMLTMLAMNVDALVPRTMILDYLYPDRTPDQKILEVYACKLRKALRQLNSSCRIETVWGRGYVLKSY